MKAENWSERELDTLAPPEQPSDTGEDAVRSKTPTTMWRYRAVWASLLAALAVLCVLSVAFLAPLHATCGATPSMMDTSLDACNGNGIRFADDDGCACFDCWAGEGCDERLHESECTIAATSGTPYIFESYWVNHPEPTITILPIAPRVDICPSVICAGLPSHSRTSCKRECQTLVGFKLYQRGRGAISRSNPAPMRHRSGRRDLGTAGGTEIKSYALVFTLDDI